MNCGLERILTLTFGKDGNEANYLGNGWSGDEPGSRWMIGQGSELWLEHPGQGHDLILELEIGVMGLRPGTAAQRLVVGVRNQGIAQIAAVTGGTAGFHIPAALVAAPGPVRIVFIHPDFARPMDVHGGSDDRSLSFSVRSLALFRVPTLGPVAAGQVAAGPVAAGTVSGGAVLPFDQMITRFESLGDTCEFGLVQRQMGAEPLGLLRFSFIDLPMLLRGLRSGFEGLGDPETTDVIIDGKDREFVVRESVYGMTYHTFQYEHQMTRDTVRRQQATRLDFLRRKLLEDIANGEKIFVIKRTPGLRPEEILPLFSALNEQRRNWLLWMVAADAAHPPGTVEMLLPGLLRGYIDRFAPSENAHDLSMPVWAAVCEATWRAVGGALGGS
jgi:hypothetical protein